MFADDSTDKSDKDAAHGAGNPEDCKIPGNVGCAGYEHGDDDLADVVGYSANGAYADGTEFACLF